ncbi:DUF2164 domain-containing protein [Kineobactrum sediminis]|uniref:DUF2164 domain-containing protein n=1 Tax=Kineobactrum sediminis TaxID=1905677 RepID=A0A2N5Y621_9GAMM|nr:DUF2164 domain-containing protein [Kineobactrum sediminis]PLW83837.1 DUF2164 domain-containing protein [Kineobactrum sediminis]
MSEVNFSDGEKEQIVSKVKLYFREELDQDIGSFDAEFLIDFFTRELGAYFYNRGLYDSQTILASKLEDLADSILELEKPTTYTR